MPGAIRDFLEDYPPGTPVALESVGNWYWIVDEIEASGCIPLLEDLAYHSYFPRYRDYTFTLVNDELE
jgi:hypothetical protein